MIPGKHFGPKEILGAARRRKWLIFVPAVVVVTGVAIGLHFVPDQYRSETLILVVPQRVPESYVRATVTTRIEDRLQSITQQILSRTRLERIIQDFNLYARDRKTGIMEDIVEQMRKSIEVQIVKGDAFRVSFIADDARTAMKVTERLASLFIEENLRDREVLAEGTNQFLEAQLEDSRRRLVDNERKLEEYRRAHAGELPSQKEGNLQGQHNVEMQIQSLVDSLSRDRDRRLVLERMLADDSTPDAAAAPPVQMPVTTPVDPFTPGLPSAEQLKAARATLEGLEQRMTPAHPDIIRLKRIIAELETKADAESAAHPVSPSAPGDPSLTPAAIAKKNRADAMRAELDNVGRDIGRKQAEEKRLRAILAEYQKRIEATPTREAELAELTRDYETLQEVYRTLLAKKEDSKVAANLERRQIGEQFKILDPARLPEKPYSPDRIRLTVLSVLLGIGLGVAIAALLEYDDERLRSEDDVRATIGLPVLATIPLIVAPPSLMRWRRRLVAASVVGVVGLTGAAAVAWKLLR